jgi:hypothetical protein
VKRRRRGKRADDEQPVDLEPPKLAVEPLTCPACSGGVPLVDGDATTCPYCGARVVIPAAHRQVRDAMRARETNRAALEAQYRRIGKPPGLLLRVWSGAAAGTLRVVFAIATGFLALWAMLLGFVWDLVKSIDDLAAFVFVLVLPLIAMFFLLLGAAHGLRIAAPLFGVDLIDRFSLAGGFLFLGALVWLLFPLPIAIRDYLDAYANIRRKLQASLAAKPPSMPGGPAGCRHRQPGRAAGALGRERRSCDAPPRGRDRDRRRARGPNEGPRHRVRGPRLVVAHPARVGRPRRVARENRLLRASRRTRPRPRRAASALGA